MKKSKLTKIVALGALICLGMFTTGCGIRAPYVPPMGAVFSEVSAPLDIEHHETDLGSKVGKAESISILGLVALGDASTRAAATNGGIDTIKSADYEYFNVLFVFQRATVVVRGD